MSTVNSSDLFQAEYHGKPVSVKKYSADSDKDIRAFLEEAAIMTYVEPSIHYRLRCIDTFFKGDTLHLHLGLD